jgi:hypothetical protein
LRDDVADGSKAAPQLAAPCLLPPAADIGPSEHPLVKPSNFA